MLKFFTGVLLALLLVLLNCQAPMPGDLSPTAPTIVNVQFSGFKISDLNLNKSGLNQIQSFEKIIIEVFEMGLATDNLTQAQPISSTEIMITPGSNTFEGRIEVPAGRNRLFIGKLFEKFSQTVPDQQDTLSFVSYCGRKAGVDIEIDKLNVVELRLHPVPIYGKRVVLWSWPITIKANNIPPVALGIMTLDTLRGIQFDIDFNPQVLQIQSVDTTSLSGKISEFHLNNIQEVGTRIVAFTRFAERNILYPVIDSCAEPFAFMKINLITVPGQSLNVNSIEFILKNARISALNYVPLDVFLIPASIEIESN